MVGRWIRFTRDWSTYRRGSTLPLQPSLADWLVARGFAAYLDGKPAKSENQDKPQECPPETSAADDAQREPPQPEAATRRRGRPPRAQ